MSIRLMSLAWELPLTPTVKLVLLALCDWANDAGICFPAVATVARKTSISKRHCQRIMADLNKVGLVVVVGNVQGGVGSRRYQIDEEALRGSAVTSTRDKLSPVAARTRQRVTHTSKQGDTEVARTNSNHQADPPLQDALHSIDWSHLSQLSEKEQVVVVDMLDDVAESQHQDIVDELAGALKAKAIKSQWPGWLRGVVRQARVGAFVPNRALAVQRDRQRMARETEDAEKRRAEEKRRLDPEARARGLAAMQAAIAEMGLSPKGTKSSS